MNPTRIKTIGGVTINLADLKCLKPPRYDDNRNVLIFQFKTRYGYILNPETNSYEKQEYNETTEEEFYSYDSLIAHRDEWIAAWRAYLEESVS